MWGTGKVYTLAVPLNPEYSNFARHALFVATTLRMAELSQSTSMLSSYISAEAFFALPAINLSGESVFKLSSTDRLQEVIPGYILREGQLEVSPGPDITKSGNYLLTLGVDTISVAGLNYNRNESNLDSYSRDELLAIVASNDAINASVFDGNTESLTRTLTVEQKGTELWKWCLFLILVFLLLESLLIRFWNKNAS